MELERIGPYRLERKLGTGGMGVVYAAWDERLERRVALKQIRPEVAGDLLRQRFRREARAVAQLDHPAIVRIYDLLETADGDWLVLQYVEGPTLAQRLREGPLPPARVAALAVDVLGALEAAHSAGLLHRDLKAENVVLAPSGHALVLDFGLAKLYSPGPDAPGESVPGTMGTAGVLGTYRAMSPEQANGLALDPRSDLFSLGVLLYEAATGISPFQAATPIATLARVCTHLQPPVHELVPEVPEPLSALIDSLLEKDVTRRPRSAGEALARIESGSGDAAAPPDTGQTVSSTPFRASHPVPPAAAPASDPDRPFSVTPYRGLRPRRLPLAAALVLLAALGVFLAWRLRLPSSPSPLPGPLYVTVARPEVGLGAGREDVALAAAALQAASLRALTSLEGVAALPPGAPEAGEPAPTVQRLSRLLAAEEVLTATLDCQARQCQAVLRRQRGSDGKVIESTAPFEVPLEDLHLLGTAISTYLKPLYSGFNTRPGASPLRVRGEDYQRYLRVQRQWSEARPADLQPLLAELDQIRAGSPLFLDAYLLEARVEGFRFFQTRDARQLDHALSLVGEARRVAPEDPLPFDTLFSVALNAGRLNEAEEALNGLEQRLPGDARTLQQRALLSEKKGDRRKALDLLRAAVKRRPSASSMLDLANLEMRLGEMPAARTTLEDLLRRVPGFASGENLLAQLELETGDPARAADLYAALARRRPGFAVLSNLGVSQLMLGRYQEAATSLRKAYSLSPDTFGAALNLADAETLLGRRAEGEALYRRVLELTSHDPAQDDWQLLAARAQAQAHLGYRTEAAASIQQAVVVAPNNPDLAFEAALVYTLIGDTASAVASADRAVAHGFNRHWFVLPWFDRLRNEPVFSKPLAP
ncbi:MAG TPA: protein kinase [Thermoanaerobaculia bacterium]|jgi:serine/threonine-protein kinase|nr:protein kinase [Thermoanaerobaculia bacterium]